MHDILIIGGMGPQAGLLLHQRLIAYAAQRGARQNHEYPLVTHLSLPVQDFITDGAKRSEAVRLIRKRLERLWRT